MKTIFAAAVAVSMLAVGVASAAPMHHRAHKVCHVYHHHRSCHWVR